MHSSSTNASSSLQPVAPQRQNGWGGSAGAGGTNFHSRVAAYVAVHVIAGRALGWLPRISHDVPCDLWFETNGPGDDLRFDLKAGEIVEIQVKKGLQRGSDLWTALTLLARGIHSQAIAYGVLVVDSEASSTVRDDLAQGIRRLGDARTDDLNDITNDFLRRLNVEGLPVAAVCSKLRIQKLQFSEHDQASLQVAVGELRCLCDQADDAQAAWNGLELAAHELIERRGRWDAQAIAAVLKTADIALAALARSLVPVSAGFAWESFDSAFSERSLIEAFRQHYLAPGETGAQPFGGRDAELTRLQDWLFDRHGPARMVVAAPTARGKSALLVRWTERLREDSTWAIVFVPISLRFGTDVPATYYGLLAAQLAKVLGVELAAPMLDHESHYLGACMRLIGEAGRQKRRLLVVIDGLDESSGRDFNPELFPRALAQGIKVLVSAREQAGDAGPEGWRRRLSWDGQGVAKAESLDILSRKSVRPVLASAGVPVATVDDELVDRLMELTVGEPFLLSLYAEELAAAVVVGQRVNAGALADRVPGFSAYFERAFGSRSGVPVTSEAHEATLAVLSLAAAPLCISELTDLACQLSGVAQPAVRGVWVAPFKRFVTGDGSDAHGYVLNHPKLGEYLREERFVPEFLRRTQQAFIDWGRRTADLVQADPDVHASAYVLQRHVHHLLQADAVDLDDLELLTSEGWRRARFRLEGEYAGYADALGAAAARISLTTCPLGELGRAVRLKIRVTLHVGSIKAQGLNFPAELLGFALGASLVSLRQALNIVRLNEPANRMSYRVALMPHLPDDMRDELVRNIQSIGERAARMDQLARVSAHLPADQRVSIVEQVQEWLASDCPVEQRLGIGAQLVRCVDQGALLSWLSQMLIVGVATDQAVYQVITLMPVLDRLQTEGLAEAADRLIAWCQQAIDVSQEPLAAATAITALGRRTGASRIATQRAKFAPLVQSLATTLHTRLPHERVIEGHIRRERVLRASLGMAILDAEGLPLTEYRARVHQILKPVMTPNYFDVQVYTDLIPLLRLEMREEAIEKAAGFAAELLTANNRAHALLALARDASPATRRRLVELAMPDTRRIDDEYGRGLSLAALFESLPATSREPEIPALLKDVQSIRYVGHQGQLMFNLTKLMPGVKGLAERATQLTLMLEDVDSAATTVMRELMKLPEALQLKLFEQCWDIMVRPGGQHAAYQAGFAARWAPQYWSARHLDIARRLVLPAPDFTRIFVLINLLPVAQRLGAKALMEEAFEAAISDPEPSGAALHLAQCLPYMDVHDPRRARLPPLWEAAANADKPNVNHLIEAYTFMSPSDQAQVWPKLVLRVRASEQPGNALLRLRDMSGDVTEQDALLEAAFEACSQETPDARMTLASHIAAAAGTPLARRRALELMTATTDSARGLVLTALGNSAPALLAEGDVDLVLAVMGEVREVGAWWP